MLKKNGPSEKLCNFFVFQPILIKIKLESDLDLNRSFPASFYDPVIFGTPYVHISEKIDDFDSHPQNHRFFINMSIATGGTKNHRIIKTPRK